MALSLISAQLALQDMIRTGNLSVSGLFDLAAQVDAQVHNVAPGSTFLLYSGGADAAATSANLASTAPDVYDIGSTAAGEFLDSQAFGSALRDAFAKELFNTTYKDATSAEEASIKASVNLHLYGTDAAGNRVSNTSLFDVVSHSYVMENDGDWRIIATGSVDPNSVAMQTELPALLSKPGDFFINGESRAVLAQGGALAQQVDMAIAQSAAISQASLVSPSSAGEFLSMTIKDALQVLAAPESAALLESTAATLNKLGWAGALLSAALVSQEANAAYASGNNAQGDALIEKWAAGFAGGWAAATLASQVVGSALAPMYLTGPAGALIAGGLTLLAGLTAGVIGASGASALLPTLEALFRSAVICTSPLELDLTGDGVQTIGLSAGVHFDYTGSGFAQSTGWAAPQDGLLVLPDPNGNVTQGSELFGNNTVLPNGALASNGFQALAALDSNHDGVIDAKDAAFAQLRLWVGGNGQPGSGQLLTLTQAGIQSLTLKYTAQNSTDANGNQIRQVGSYTLTNGTTRAMDDVWFSVNTAETVDMSTPVAVSAIVAALPSLAGAGNLHSLQQAMARDTSGKLQSIVQTFVNSAGTMTPDQARAAAEAILFDWTGADRYSATSRGTYIDGREIYALEAFMGQPFSQALGGQNPFVGAAEYLHTAYTKLLDWTTAQLLVQTKYAPWINEIGLTTNAMTGSMTVDVSQLTASLSALYASNGSQTAADINEFGQSLKSMGSTGTQILSALQQQGSVTGTGFSLALATMGYTAVIGNSSTATLNGVQNEDSMLVGVAGETLIAGNGDDVLVAGGGRETLDSGSGNDTFVFNQGSGQVRINDAYVTKVAASNQDVVRLGKGFTPAGTTTARNLSNDLILSFGNGDQLTVAGYFNQGANDPSIVFSDGTTWRATDVIGWAPLQDTTSGHQTLTGAMGLNDTIIAGTGDMILAGSGIDTIVVNAGSGAVTLNERPGIKTAGIDQDVIKLGAGIIAAGTTPIRTMSNDLILSFGNGDQLTIGGYFKSAQSRPSIVFADGTTWNTAFLAGELPLTDTTAGGNTLTGATDIDDTIVGAANDTINAGNLNDTITIGKGDRINAGAGLDTFLFKTGDGSVVVDEGHVTKTGGADKDVFKLGPGISAASTQVRYDQYGDLLLTFGNGDQLTVQGYLIPNVANQTTIQFADGTSWDYSTVVGQMVWQDTSAGNNTLNGLHNVNNTIIGAAGDTIYAGNLNDKITAGKSNTLYAGTGVDTFIYNAGDGSVVVNEGAFYANKTGGVNADVFKLGAGISAAATQIKRTVSNDLILSFGNGDQLTVLGYFRMTPKNQTTIAFSDGTNWNYATVAGAAVLQDTSVGNNTIYGLTGVNNTMIGAAGDTIYAGNLNDTITAGKNNRLYSGAGIDTFVFNPGDGTVYLNDTYVSKSGGVNQDMYKLGAGITPAGTQVRRDLSNNLVLVFGNGDQLLVQGYLNSSVKNQTTIQFADGTTWDYASVIGKMVLQDTSAGNNTIYGLTGINNTMIGAAGDTIYAGNLNDTITAGKNDHLYSGAGIDTFVFNSGDGTVYLNDAYVSKSGGMNQDVYKLGAGITPAGTQVRRDLFNNLVLVFGNGDQLSVQGYLNSAVKNQTTIQFADGTRWDYASVIGKMVLQDTSAGNNTIHGLTGINNTMIGAAGDAIYAGNLNDTITAGKNDRLYAGAGVDLFEAGVGCGAVAINEATKTSGSNQDTLLINGVDQDQLWFKMSGNNLTIDIMGTTDQITIANWALSTANQLQTIEVDGGPNGKSLLSPGAVSQLVQAMASFSASHSGFDPTSASTPAITDSNLLLAVDSSWRH